MDRDELLKQLTMLDFMATDLDLYLNTHPYDKDAIKDYNAVVANANKARVLYEKLYGPLCSYRSCAEDGWRWINDPWPWCESGNFELCREERF